MISIPGREARLAVEWGELKGVYDPSCDAKRLMLGIKREIMVTRLDDLVQDGHGIADQHILHTVLILCTSTHIDLFGVAMVERV